MARKYYGILSRDRHVATYCVRRIGKVMCILRVQTRVEESMEV